MKKISRLSVIAISAALGIFSTAVYADPPMPPFYASVMKISPEGKLGQVISKEKIAIARGCSDNKEALRATDNTIAVLPIPGRAANITKSDF